MGVGEGVTVRPKTADKNINIEKQRTFWYKVLLTNIDFTLWCYERQRTCIRNKLTFALPFWDKLKW